MACGFKEAWSICTGSIRGKLPILEQWIVGLIEEVRWVRKWHRVYTLSITEALGLSPKKQMYFSMVTAVTVLGSELECAD